jgi:cell wall-associated NlpC family hydrolase
VGAGTALAVFALLSGCAPKKVTGPRAPSGPEVRREAAASARDPRLPPELPDRLPAPGEPESLLPEPRMRVASGAVRMGTEEPRGGASVALGDQAAALAKLQLGKQYQWGAAGPDRFDCSGLVMYVYQELGVDLPRVSAEQAAHGRKVDRGELQPGDLVFFQLNGSRIDHVGIYLGRNKFVHAPRRHMPVRTDSLNNAYWRQRYRGARRVG